MQLLEFWSYLERLEGRRLDRRQLLWGFCYSGVDGLEASTARCRYTGRRQTRSQQCSPPHRSLRPGTHSGLSQPTLEWLTLNYKQYSEQASRRRRYCKHPYCQSCVCLGKMRYRRIKPMTPSGDCSSYVKQQYARVLVVGSPHAKPILSYILLQ